MQATDAQVLRGAVVPTVVTGGGVCLAAAMLAGVEGLVGALLGVCVVVGFFAAGLVAVGRVARGNPYLLLNAALATYLVKIIVLAGLLFALRDVTVFDTKAFAWAILTCTLVWVVAEVRAFSRLKILYVDPDRGA